MKAGEKRRAGRPRQFERRVAVEAALEAFWGRPFTDVSVNDLENATGIVRTSLYNAFGNKRGLFNAALDHYLAGLFAEINRRLTEGPGGLDDIHQFLDWLQVMFTDSTRGCMMINSMIEFGDADPVIAQRGSRYIQTLTNGFCATLARAQHCGEIPPTLSIEAAANQLGLQTLGLNLAARIGLAPEQIQQLFSAAHDGIRALQPTDRG